MSSTISSIEASRRASAVPIQHALAVNTTLSGLTPAAAAVTTISLDLGVAYAQYLDVGFVFSGVGDSGNAVGFKGSSDNVTFFYLPVVSETGGGSLNISLLGRTAGFRYIQGIFTNGATAQTDAVLLLSVQ